MKKSLLLGMAAALIAGMSSCSNDDLLKPDRNTPLEEDQTFYCGIDIRNVGESGGYNAPKRIGGGLIGDEDGVIDGSYDYDPSDDPGFNKGEAQENAVNTI